MDKKSGRHYFHGKGLMKFAGGDVYEGMWEDGQMHGYGFYFYAEDFEGSDSEDEETKGEKKPKPKPEYEGLFEKGMRSEGTMRYSNGDSFVGLFDREGLKINGNIMYANGDEFAGDFENGAKKRGI